MKRSLSILCFFINCAAEFPGVSFFPLDSANATVYKIYAYRASSTAENIPVNDSIVRKFIDYRVVDSLHFIRIVQDNNEQPLADSCEVAHPFIYCRLGVYEIADDYVSGGDVRTSFLQVGLDSFFLYEYTHTSPSLARTKTVSFYQRGVGLVYSHSSKTATGLSDEIQSSDESILISFRGKAIDGKAIYNSVMQSTSLMHRRRKLNRKGCESVFKTYNLLFLNGRNDILGRIVR